MIPFSFLVPSHFDREGMRRYRKGHQNGKQARKMEQTRSLSKECYLNFPEINEFGGKIALYKDTVWLFSAQ